MPISSSSAFKVQAAAESNLPAAKVELVLGDYCNAAVYGSTATASSTDGSGNFPAAGAINGDRTELNIGAASGSDNGVGRSSWKSAIACPGSPSFVSYQVSFAPGRTINRIKLYHLSGHGLKSFAIFALDYASTLIPIGTTTGTPWAIAAITTNGQLDTYDFADIPNVYAIIVLIYDTQVGSDKPTIVELECYRKVDITSRVISVQSTQSRDYKLANPMATSAKITVDNSDRFFSISHNPTLSELAAGFVNNELGPQIGVIISQGFRLYNALPEIYQNFVGFVDDITPTTGSRSATITARDGMKNVINKIDSTNLKTNVDIAEAMEYILNRANISSWEMALDTTGINLNYFFTDAEQQLTTIQNLVQASGDAQFYFDHNGIATFKFYTEGVTNQFIYTSQTDWQAGTLTAVDTISIPGDMLMDFTDAAAEVVTTYMASTSGWTLTWVGTTPSVNPWSIGADGLQWHEANGNTLYYAEAARTIGTVFGRWDCTFKLPANTANILYWNLCMGIGIVAKNSSWQGGYAIKFSYPSGTPTIDLVRRDFAGPPSFTVPEVVLGSSAITVNAHDTITVDRSPTGVIRVHQNGSLLITAVDTTYNGHFLGNTGFEIQVNANDIVTFGATAYSTPTAFVADDILPVLDTGVATVSFGLLTATQYPNGGAIYYKTRSGPTGHAVPDGSWTAWSSAFAAGSPIPSTAQRYLQVDVFLDSTGQPNNSNPDILDVTVNWATSSASSKYPFVSSFTFKDVTSLLENQEQISDTLGGDSAILNDVSVQAQPLVLTGNSSDTVWQGTVGTPPTPISGSTSLSVPLGTYTFPVYTGGSDISAMSGSNPAAGVVTFGGGGAGSWSFTKIHPTRPVLQVVVTTAGTLTDLRVVGKQFTNANFIQIQEVTDAFSSFKYGSRQQSLSNPWIVSATIANLIATALVAALKKPVILIPRCRVQFEPDLLLGDRVTIEDQNLDLSKDFIAAGVQHTYDAASKKIDTELTLLGLP